MFKKLFFVLFLISFCFALNKVSAEPGNSTKTSDEEFLITAHGISLLIIWGILVEIPIGAIRSYKAVKIHLALFIILDLWTLTSVFFVSKQNFEKIRNLSFKSNVSLTHCICGLSVAFFIICQHIGGFIAYTNPKATFIKQMHRTNGWILYYITKISLLTGSYMFDQTLL